LKKIFITAFLLLLVDQALKIWVKTSMELWDKFPVIESSFLKFNIWFVENPGMAFGWDIMPKGMLTILRIIIVLIGISYINFLSKKKLPNGCLASLGLVIGGAIGNIIDSVFYGVCFNHSYKNIATFLPESGGYANWFQGEVVDMFSFHFFTIDLPDWLAIPIPFSQETILSVLEGYDGLFTFFAPIFNLADSGISVGVMLLVIFYRKNF